MLYFVGVAVVLGSVAGGYIWHGGILGLLWQPSEVLIILGAAFGAFLIANSLHTVKDTGKQLPRAIFGSNKNSALYLDLLGLLYDIFNKARREGMIEGLERAVDLVTNSNDALAIRAEIERLKA